MLVGDQADRWDPPDRKGPQARLRTSVLARRSQWSVSERVPGEGMLGQEEEARVGRPGQFSPCGRWFSFFIFLFPFYFSFLLSNSI
jgi:hypothetical protein